MSWFFSQVILRRKHFFKRNLGSPVKNCPKISLIYLSESVRRRAISFGCDIYVIVIILVFYVFTTRVTRWHLQFGCIPIQVFFYLDMHVMRHRIRVKRGHIKYFIIISQKKFVFIYLGCLTAANLLFTTYIPKSNSFSN